MSSVLRRLEALEAKVPKPPARGQGPPMDLTRLTSDEQAELWSLAAMVDWEAGHHPNMDALGGEQLNRLEDLCRKGWGLEPRIRREWER